MACISTLRMKMEMKRAVGYCSNVGNLTLPGCEDYSKGVFLLNHGKTFYCPRCRHLGKVVKEAGFADHVEDQPFKEVRVEFNYDPVEDRFREIAIVRDEAIFGSGSKYTLMSPLIKTEKRALKVSEAILANLQRYSNILEDGIPKTTEIIISFDEDVDVFSRKLKDLGEEWESSTLSKSKSEKPPSVEDDFASRAID
jgi:hypothetical protein